MHCVVAPLLHRYFVHPAGAQSWVVLPTQIVVLPVMVQAGAVTVVTVFEQVLVHPAAFVTVTV